ncbi:MAG: flavodoxin family protein [Acetobacterium sp.]
MKKILCISGSPIKNSNTDRMLKNIADRSGFDYDFIKLSDWLVRPCLACKACVTTNQCVQKDDFEKISKLISGAEAIIFGVYTPYGMIDAFSKVLLERLWSMRHINSLNSGKFAITVVTSVNKNTAEQINQQLMMEMVMEKFILLDQLVINGTVPCFTCGKGDICGNSGVPMQVGENGIVSDANCFDVENQSVFEKGKELGKLLGDYLRNDPAFDKEGYQKNINEMMEQIMPVMDQGMRQWREDELKKVNMQIKKN